MRTRIVRTLAGFVGLEREWLRLWSFTGLGPFQSPHWLLNWWRHFGEGELLVVVVEDSATLTALAPLYIYHDPDTHCRKLLWVGSGNTDYLDLICPQAEAYAVAELIVNRITDCRREWDICELFPLPANSAWRKVSAGRAVQFDVCPVLPLPGDVADLTNVVPARQLQNIGYYRRRAEKFGTIAVTSASANSVDAYMGMLCDLHNARWRDRAESGALAEKRTRSFHLAAARAFGGVGLLRLNVLQVNGAIIGAWYGFAHGKRTYYYIGGFNPEFRDLSPGTLLIAHAVEQAVQEGCNTFDFLRGSERYKYLWGALDEPVFQWTAS